MLLELLPMRFKSCVTSSPNGSCMCDNQLGGFGEALPPRAGLPARMGICPDDLPSKPSTGIVRLPVESLERKTGWLCRHACPETNGPALP